MKRTVMFSIAVLTLFMCPSCFPVPAGSVRLVSDQVPPTFEFKGRLDLQYIHVVGPYFAQSQDSDPVRGNNNSAIWKISPPGFRFIPVNETPPITYGQLPQNWEQEIPKTGSPPPLVDGGIYYVDAELIKGRRINMCIVIREGKAKQYRSKVNGLTCDN